MIIDAEDADLRRVTHDASPFDPYDSVIVRLTSRRCNVRWLALIVDESCLRESPDGVLNGLKMLWLVRSLARFPGS